MTTINKLELLSDKQNLISKSDTPAKKIIDAIYDEGSFVEVGKFVKARPSSEASASTESVITGWGCINYKKTYCFSQDITTQDGSISEMHCSKIKNVLSLASKTGHPVIGIFDSKGDRISEGVMVLNGYSSVMGMIDKLSGVVPMIAVIKGPCYGNMAVIAQMFDFVIVTGDAKVGIIPKDQMNANELLKNGLAHFTAKNDLEVRELIEKIFSYIPSNNCNEQDLSKISFGAEKVDIDQYIPDEMDKQSDMAQIIKAIADEGTYLEYLKEYCGSMICAFARLNGITAGIIANNSSYTENGIVKASRFINLCDNYDIPLVTLVDNPGYAKSTYPAGMAEKLSKLVFSYAMATSVKITVLIKKAIGAGYTCMCPKELGADVCVALPSAVISLDTVSKEDANLDESKYFESFCSPYQAAKLGLIDDIILPEKLKDIITKSIKAMYTKREEKLLKKHINTPL